MPIDPSQLIARLRSLAPFEDDAAARRCCEATLKALRHGLTDQEADWLAIDLGPVLSAPLVREAYVGELSLDLLYRRVARFDECGRKIARERAKVFCQALTELLPTLTTARLQRCLPKLAPLFTHDAQRLATGPAGSPVAIQHTKALSA